MSSSNVSIRLINRLTETCISYLVPGENLSNKCQGFTHYSAAGSVSGPSASAGSACISVSDCQLERNESKGSLTPIESGALVDEHDGNFVFKQLQFTFA